MQIISLEIKNLIYFFGFSTIGICIVLIFLQITMLIALLRKINLLLKNYIFIIITWIVFFELLQQIILLIGGIFYVTFTKPPIIIERALGAILGSSYIFIAILQLYLSVTRLNTFFNYSKINNKLNKKIFYKSLLILSAIYICLIIFYSTDQFRINISITECGWYFWENKENYYRLYHIDATVYLLLCLLTLIFFISIIIKVFYDKKKTLNSKTIYGKYFIELRLSIQAIIHFTFTAILQLFFVYGRVWFPYDRNLFRNLNLAWTLSTGCTTISNLIFLRDIRILFFQLFFCYKKKLSKAHKSTKIKMISKNIEEQDKKNGLYNCNQNDIINNITTTS
uniref:G-protein coupled receptors family 1 profile domain-containing protein n=1 Tax=Strongyloides stercoralis TaxID=6248 RepID=A0A0K0E342_STRER